MRYTRSTHLTLISGWLTTQLLEQWWRLSMWYCAAWSGDGERWIWANGRNMISRGNLMKLGEERTPVPLRIPWILHIVT
jgi:hypothetical protein